MSIGIALSGGGAKGAAHIGVLQALKEEGIQIDYVSGASSGSIVATLYACGYSPYTMLYMFNNYCKYVTDYDRFLPFKIISVLFTGKINIKYIVKGKNLEGLIRRCCDEKNVSNIQDIKFPLAISTVDINTGEIIYFLNKKVKEEKQHLSRNRLYDDIPSYYYDGSIASIVRASSSFPVVFEPKCINGKMLIDGGVRMNCPIEVLKKMGADKVIAVSFDDKLKQECGYPNVISAATRSFDIMGHQVNFPELEKADYVIRPKIKNMSLLELNKSSYCANKGYIAVKENIDKIKEAVGVK